MQAPFLAASDIACRRGERVLFRGLSLRLEPGEAVQIAGANGIGKSSLLRIVAGLLPPFSGTLESSGAIGLIDERAALDAHLPLGKALAFWARLDGSAGEAAERLGLSGLLDVPVRYLSTGQRKRAALARLCGQGVAHWLLDEVLNGLDSEAVQTAQALAAEHCAAGGTCLIASHQAFDLPGMKVLSLAEFTP